MIRLYCHGNDLLRSNAIMVGCALHPPWSGGRSTKRTDARSSQRKSNNEQWKFQIPGERENFVRRTDALLDEIFNFDVISCYSVLSHDTPASQVTRHHCILILSSSSYYYSVGRKRGKERRTPNRDFDSNHPKGFSGRFVIHYRNRKQANKQSKR